MRSSRRESGGSTQGVDDGTQHSFAGPTLPDRLAQQGITWRAYMESMPSACYGGADGGHIATIVIAANQQAHATSAASVDHAGTLRTIEQLYGVPFLGDAACTCSGDLTALIPAAQPAPAPTASLTWLTVPHRR